MSLEQGGNCGIIEFNMPDSAMFASWDRDEPTFEAHILSGEFAVFSLRHSRIQRKIEFGNMMEIKFLGYSSEPLLLFREEITDHRIVLPPSPYKPGGVGCGFAVRHSRQGEHPDRVHGLRAAR